MGVRVDFQTSGIVGITELFAQTVSGDTTLTGQNPEDASSFAIAVAMTGDVSTPTENNDYTVTLPAPTDSMGDPAIKVGSVLKFKYLLDVADETAMPAQTQPTVTIARNGSPIDGGTDDITINTPNYTFEIIYFGGSLGWVVL